MSRRIITEKAIHSFYANENFKQSNTEVVANAHGTFLLLWGNCIARRCGNRIQINLCGYNTVTTRERLNGLRNVRVSTKKGIATLNGEPIEIDKWYQVAEV